MPGTPLNPLVLLLLASLGTYWEYSLAASSSPLHVLFSLLSSM